MPKMPAPPATPFPSDDLHRSGALVWAPLKHEWRDLTGKPEEEVRQEFVRHLHVVLGYDLAQMGQELRTQSGTKSVRADIVVWGSATDKIHGASPKIVVECKAESVSLNLKDYYQGESYARSMGAEFFVAHNRRFTEPFEVVPAAPGKFKSVVRIPSASDWGDAKRIKAIKETQRAFNRAEFTRLLQTSHDIIRDVHKKDPTAAFDAISKVLFIKMFVERSGLHGTFTTAYLDNRKKLALPGDLPVHQQLFDQTKNFYRADNLFTEKDTLDISEATFRRIVETLQAFDLAKTGDDVKGIAFEKFLGATFRGELGQFFTPRPVVDFMVDMVDPQEGQLVCDPAAGSGGFLIRAFEHVRADIEADLQAQKDARRAQIEGQGLDPEVEADAIKAAFIEINRELLPSTDDNRPVDTRLGRLAWNCIYGADAEPRAARTAKMNMIMHGDGHGGIHHHDGLVDVNGIFPDRFDLIVTNPPFGSAVGRDQRLGDSDETSITTDAGRIAQHRERYGEAWSENHARLSAAQEARTPVLDLFEIGRDKASRDTEVIFVERCLSLLKPGGLLNIVLPDGNLNNPSLNWLRRWCEGRAKLLAVVSLPEETFRSSKASVKCSVVTLRRFTSEDETAWQAAWDAAHAALDATFAAERDAACMAARQAIITGSNPDVAEAIATLAALGVEPIGPSWKAGPVPAYPRMAAPSRLEPVRWRNDGADAKKIRAAKAALQAAWIGPAKAAAADASSALARDLRRIDAGHTAALWAHVRAAFDYPVFLAAPKGVGISSTGDTGQGVANDLPQVLKAWRAFRAWTGAGAKAEDLPDFQAPPAA
ncbi:N-6 DNA methylase [Caulobacter sp. RL271]|uniref:N-6 DNA methylase n=1 Tax=Caulobacter segnis TaxID=88688 RepID=A0ABY4ZRT2_9CAUL|nr:N-6 DNA methylase [Caulobacter segnis]USQ95308.1 N-6 DNA methylase [Caulobacter segnis]